MDSELILDHLSCTLFFQVGNSYKMRSIGHFFFLAKVITKSWLDFCDSVLCYFDSTRKVCFRIQCWIISCLLYFLSALSGVAKLWSMPQIRKVSTLKGHTERLTDISFSPVHNLLATASADRTAKLWNTEGSLLKTFEGHLDRLARIAFHPSGKYLGTASFDKTWRLWDVDTGVELLLQEGHSRSIYGIAFHNDGSLAASCGLDSLARVWDLRTGRSILSLEGHVKPVRYHIFNVFFLGELIFWNIRHFSHSL